jgi:hypothetical protein
MKHIKIYEDFTNEAQVNEGSYDMYTPAGDKACQKLVDGIVAKINGDKRVTGEEIEKLLKDGVAKVAKTHKEVHDTEPRGEIAHQISKALKAAGYSFYFDSYGHLNEAAKLNENKKWLVFLPIKKDGSVDIDSDQFGVYTDQEYEKYAPFNVYGGPDYTTSLSFPDMKKAQEFADLVKKAKGDVKSSDYAKAAEFERKNKINESELNEGAEPKLEKHNHFIILKGDDVMDNAQTFEKAVEIYNSLKPKSRLIDGREIYQRVWQEK